MLLLRHIARTSASVVRFSTTTRRIGLLLVVVAGAVVVVLATATSTVAPLVVYPFL